MEEEVKKIATDIVTIKLLLLGNGHMGVAEMARRAFEACAECKKTRSGFLDWAFRAVITIMIGFVAFKIGLK